MSLHPAKDERFRASLISAALFPISLLLLAALEATHVKEDPMLAEDNARVGKVLLCVSVASLASVCSIFMAIRPIVAGDLRPLLWLVALALGWAAFLNWFLWPWFEVHA